MSSAIDIVYFLRVDDKNNSEELRYSLRSLKHIPHGNVFIVGEMPEWVTNVTHINVQQTGTKNQNVTTGLRKAIRSELISDDFILMNDDFFFMKDIEEMPMLNLRLMKDVIDSYEAR